jgi:hypothetical protein
MLCKVGTIITALVWILILKRICAGKNVVKQVLKYDLLLSPLKAVFRESGPGNAEIPCWYW